MLNIYREADFTALSEFVIAGMTGVWPPHRGAHGTIEGTPAHITAIEVHAAALHLARRGAVKLLTA